MNEHTASRPASEPVRYIERTRRYYAVLGFPAYEWASNTSIPWQPAARVQDARIVLITTAAPHRRELPDQGPYAPYNAAAKFYRVYQIPAKPMPDLRISHVAYDRETSPATDQESYLPLVALQRAVTDRRVGQLAPLVVGVLSFRAPGSSAPRNTAEKPSS